MYIAKASKYVLLVYIRVLDVLNLACGMQHIYIRQVGSMEAGAGVRPPDFGPALTTPPRRFLAPTPRFSDLATSLR